MHRIASVAGVALLSAGLAAPARAVGETDLFTFLHAGSRFPAARGSSDYEREGARREVEVTVTGIDRLAGRRVTVYVNRHRVGRIRVSSTGRAHRDWTTAHGQSVPRARVDSPVRVRTAAGTLIASGRYRLDRDSD